MYEEVTDKDKQGARPFEYAMAAVAQAVLNDPLNIQAAKAQADWPEWDASI